jgi:putative transposase
MKYRPDYPRRPFTNTEVACAWVAAFVGWHNDRHRHSGIRFVTPFQRHSGEAVAISRHRARVYGQARQRHPRRRSRLTRYWQAGSGLDQSTPPKDDAIPATFVMVTDSRQERHPSWQLP